MIMKLTPNKEEKYKEYNLSMLTVNHAGMEIPMEDIIAIHCPPENTRAILGLPQDVVLATMIETKTGEELWGIGYTEWKPRMEKFKESLEAICPHCGRRGL